LLFLSYAEEDREIAGEIAAWFDNQNIEIYNWLAPEQRSRMFVGEIERAIDNADAFLAILSPHLLASPWCRTERHMALIREHELQTHRSNRVFIHVLKVAETSLAGAGMLRLYNWGELVDHTNLAARLGSLTGQIRADTGKPLTIRNAQPSDVVPSGELVHQATATTDDAMKFRNREKELDDVLHGLTSPGGQHFWLVTAPPQLGKSWFIKELSSKESLAGWGSALVDLRLESPEVRADADALIARLFELPAPITTWQIAKTEIIKKVVSTKKPYLCLLDNAELVDQNTARMLRSRLGEIYAPLRDNYTVDVHLSLVVASRRDTEWRGIAPHPRLAQLPLTEFSPEVVHAALFDLAEDTGKKLYSIKLDSVAERVHKLTEGLPALLWRSLRWLDAQEWLGLEQLDDWEYFENLAIPYIKDDLLSYDSLFPRTRIAGDATSEADGKLKASIVERAFQALAPYRLFTQSHLRHHLQFDQVVCDALASLNWSLEDLWDAVSNAALLQRPLDEPWQGIHPAIRRLLYRHFYATPEAQARAHKEAREFVAIWGERQFGKEQTVGLIECLWHQAMELEGSNEADFKRQLMRSASELSNGLERSPLYTVEELRRYAAERMRADGELEAAFNQDFFSTLTDAVEDPPPPGVLK
jgi:hypothetical protein